jgi:hypothetical protein
MSLFIIHNIIIILINIMNISENESSVETIYNKIEEKSQIEANSSEKINEKLNEKSNETINETVNETVNEIVNETVNEKTQDQFTIYKKKIYSFADVESITKEESIAMYEMYTKAFEIFEKIKSPLNTTRLSSWFVLKNILIMMGKVNFSKQLMTTKRFLFEEIESKIDDVYWYLICQQLGWKYNGKYNPNNKEEYVTLDSNIKRKRNIYAKKICLEFGWENIEPILNKKCVIKKMPIRKTNFHMKQIQIIGYLQDFKEIVSAEDMSQIIQKCMQVYEIYDKIKKIHSYSNMNPSFVLKNVLLHLGKYCEESILKDRLFDDIYITRKINDVFWWHVCHDLQWKYNGSYDPLNRQEFLQNLKYSTLAQRKKYCRTICETFGWQLLESYYNNENNENNDNFNLNCNELSDDDTGTDEESADIIECDVKQNEENEKQIEKNDSTLETNQNNDSTLETNQNKDSIVQTVQNNDDSLLQYVYSWFYSK